MTAIRSAAMGAAQLKLFKRKSVLAWPITNPFTKDLINRGLLTVSKPMIKVFAGVDYHCVYVELTDAGRKLVK